MNELVGKACRCEFSLPFTEWPIPGFPAWVIVDAVDMPMVKMRSRHAGAPFWINSAYIKIISSTESE